MKVFSESLTPAAVHKIIGGEFVEKQTNELNNISDPKEANAKSIIFLDNEKFLSLAVESKAGLIIAGNRFKDVLATHSSNIIFSENSYQSVLILMNYWLKLENAHFVSAVHPTAIISTGVILPQKINIGAYTIIEDNVEIGEFTKIEPFCFVGKNSIIGDNCHLFPHVTIYEDTQIGNNVYIHSGSVIGADGFGYILHEGIQLKIPQIGQVLIHDNVEIGANTTIDRGTIGPTIIGEGTKIDNLVQIGHNCKIGKHSILCAQVGLAGSSNIGDYVYLAGQVGLAGHLTIGDKVQVGAQSGVASDLQAGKQYFGYPARDAMLAKKIMAVENNLPEIYKFINKLRKEREQE